MEETNSAGVCPLSLSRSRVCGLPLLIPHGLRHRHGLGLPMVAWSVWNVPACGHKPWDVVPATRRSSGVAPRACVRVYARVLMPPNSTFTFTYIHTRTAAQAILSFTPAVLWTADRRVCLPSCLTGGAAALVRWCPRRPSCRARWCRIGGEPIVGYIILWDTVGGTAHTTGHVRGYRAGGARPPTRMVAGGEGRC